MSNETNRAIAMSVARHLVELRGKNVTGTVVQMYVEDELPGLDSEQRHLIEDLVDGYIKVSNIHVSFDEWRVKPDGSIRTDSELRELGYQKELRHQNFMDLEL